MLLSSSSLGADTRPLPHETIAFVAIAVTVDHPPHWPIASLTLLQSHTDFGRVVELPYLLAKNGRDRAVFSPVYFRRLDECQNCLLTAGGYATAPVVHDLRARQGPRRGASDHVLISVVTQRMAEGMTGAKTRKQSQRISSCSARNLEETCVPRENQTQHLIRGVQGSLTSVGVSISSCHLCSRSTVKLPRAHVITHFHCARRTGGARIAAAA